MDNAWFTYMLVINKNYPNLEIINIDMFLEKYTFVFGWHSYDHRDRTQCAKTENYCSLGVNQSLFEYFEISIYNSQNYQAFEIIGGKEAISNINYYYN